MATINLNTILDSSNSDRKTMIEKYLDKALLARPERKPLFTGSAFGTKRGIPMRGGQYIRLTMRQSLRRPQKMLTPSGAGSDPASGATLTNRQMDIPIEWLQDYVEFSTVAEMTSWDDIKAWATEDQPEALQKRTHQLAQNACVVGRYQPGQYAADGTTTAAPFDTTVEATVTLYGNSFTFKSFPKYYAGGAADFNALVTAGTTATLTELNNIAVRLSNSGAPTIQGGKYVCALSNAMMDDILEGLSDTQKSLIQGSSNAMIKGYEDRWLGSFGKLMFVEDEIPFTEEKLADAEGPRLEWGLIHSAIILGKGALGYLDIGGKSGSASNVKIQDISKTGVSTTMGYLTPYQVAVINENFGAVYKAVVTNGLPNNYSATNTQGIYQDETLGDDG